MRSQIHKVGTGTAMYLAGQHAKKSQNWTGIKNLMLRRLNLVNYYQKVGILFSIKHQRF